MDWLRSPRHADWLQRHCWELLDFAGDVIATDGTAVWLGDDGQPLPRMPRQTYTTARMVHVHSLGSLLGRPGSNSQIESGLVGLAETLADEKHGGWVSQLLPDGAVDDRKTCYDHSFVMLAAASAWQAQAPGAAQLLDGATSVFLDHFWDQSAGLCFDEWSPDWSDCSDYRGLNSNMHATEAMLAVAEATGDEEWLDRAVRICRFVAGQAADHDWRIPEHYDQHWRPLPDFNANAPTDQFKPFGATIGHSFEWSRLMLQTSATVGGDATLRTAAHHLFHRAAADGWAADDRPGFVYTVDWSGRPVSADRLAWVVAEAINAAAVLHRATGDPAASDWYTVWWDYAADHLIDRRQGGWRHQLDDHNGPSSTIWVGKPDVYHLVQATLVPRLPVTPGLAKALARGLLV